MYRLCNHAYDRIRRWAGGICSGSGQAIHVSFRLRRLQDRHWSFELAYDGPDVGRQSLSRTHPVRRMAASVACLRRRHQGQPARLACPHRHRPWFGQGGCARACRRASRSRRPRPHGCTDRRRRAHRAHHAAGPPVLRISAEDRSDLRQEGALAGPRQRHVLLGLRQGRPPSAQAHLLFDRWRFRRDRYGTRSDARFQEQACWRQGPVSLQHRPGNARHGRPLRHDHRADEAGKRRKPPCRRRS